MRKKIFAIALCGGALAAHADGGQFLTFRLADGTEYSLSVAQGLKMTFAGGRLEAEGGGQSRSFELAALQSMRFADAPTGIAQTEAGTAPVACYDMAGRRVSAPGRGLYIEKKGNVVRKVLKR